MLHARRLLCMLMQELKLRPVLCMCVVNSVTKYLINTLMLTIAVTLKSRTPMSMV